MLTWLDLKFAFFSLGSLVTHSQHSLSYGFRVEPFLPAISASLLLSDASLISSSPHIPLMFLSRGFMTAVKPCTKALTYGLLPHPPPVRPHHNSPLCWSVTSPSSNNPLCHCKVAIFSWCCGADNSLFYLLLSSTKGPWHWSNASRLMAAQQAPFYTRDTA